MAALTLPLPDNPAKGQEVLINNSCGLSNRIFSLLFSKEMSDVCLQVGVYTFELHRLILSASSDVFKAMLTSGTWPEAHKKPVILVEEPLCEAVFFRFIEYIYSGELYLSHSTVCPLLTLADKYNVREMIPLCRSYMFEHLDAPIDKSCVLQWLKISLLRNDTEMEAAIMVFIECNFGLIMKTPDFMAADLHIVDILLSSSRLAVHSESMLLYGTIMWLESLVENGSNSEEDIKLTFHRLLCHMRWAMLTPDEIKCLQECSVIQEFFQKYKKYVSPQSVPFRLADLFYSCENEISSKESMSNINADLLRSDVKNKSTFGSNSSNSSIQNIDISLHSLGGRQELHCPTTQSSTSCLPRVYINDYWCTALTISDFLTLPQYGTQTFFFSTPGMGSGYSTQNLDWEVSHTKSWLKTLSVIFLNHRQSCQKPMIYYWS
ncbi:BTB/POZ domain-containing protein 17-like [Plakobranchus ocellatus]|uniref:BTB/POZ domain-containing protein 17-like n=1 Tax=Plakobranchus ocellatus TaxID=259542 RepID=A0AAV4BAT4_9GAST|nr:BTB/POZ domain-containing protein 17-like [Plakobranchus ocellatus]